jgi:hypothetical protein
MGSAEGIRRAPPPAQPPRTEYSLSFWVLVQFFFFFGHYYQIAWVWIPDTPLFAVHPYRALLDLSVLLELSCRVRTIRLDN